MPLRYLHDKLNMDYLCHIVPFMALTAKATPPNRPMVTRIIEQLVVGMISGFFVVVVGMYVAIQVIDQRLININQHIADVATNASQLTAAIQHRQDRDEDIQRQDAQALRDTINNLKRGK